MEKIDLRSDTLTHPSPGMIEVMAKAEVGDDAYGEDREVIALQEYCAEFFGKPAALLMPSGIMSNQVALRALTQPGDEVICDASYHINFFESAQSADLGKVTLNALSTEDGILTAESLKHALESKARWTNTYAAPTLVWLENSISTHGGSVYPFAAMQDVSAWSREQGLSVFIDGARILHACIAADVSPVNYAAQADALTMCFSKGLGAPFGSILVGDVDFIARARKFRKWYGGGLHQIGHLAAAALYALKNNVQQLVEDHDNAKILAELLAQEKRLILKPAETNMVTFDVAGLGVTASEFVRLAAEEGVRLMAWRGDEVRAVTSSNVTRAQAIQAGQKLLRVSNSFDSVLPLSKHQVQPERNALHFNIERRERQMIKARRAQRSGSLLRIRKRPSTQVGAVLNEAGAS
jgi:threonine aldolase